MVKWLGRVDTVERPTAASYHMPDASRTPSTPARTTEYTTSYEGVQTVVAPEAPDHYTVTVREADGTTHCHAVERAVVNTAGVRLDDPIWFVDVDVEVGVPVDGHGDVVWVWA